MLVKIEIPMSCHKALRVYDKLQLEAHQVQSQEINHIEDISGIKRASFSTVYY
jgi:hypothetical protein